MLSLLQFKRNIGTIFLIYFFIVQCKTNSTNKKNNNPNMERKQISETTTQKVEELRSELENFGQELSKSEHQDTQKIGEMARAAAKLPEDQILEFVDSDISQSIQTEISKENEDIKTSSTSDDPAKDLSAKPENQNIQSSVNQAAAISVLVLGTLGLGASIYDSYKAPYRSFVTGRGLFAFSLSIAMIHIGRMNLNSQESSHDLQNVALTAGIASILVGLGSIAVNANQAYIMNRDLNNAQKNIYTEEQHKYLMQYLKGTGVSVPSKLKYISKSMQEAFISTKTIAPAIIMASFLSTESKTYTYEDVLKMDLPKFKELINHKITSQLGGKNISDFNKESFNALIQKNNDLKPLPFYVELAQTLTEIKENHYKTINSEIRALYHKHEHKFSDDFKNIKILGNSQSKDEIEKKLSYLKENTLDPKVTKKIDALRSQITEIPSTNFTKRISGYSILTAIGGGLIAAGASVTHPEPKKQDKTNSQSTNKKDDAAADHKTTQTKTEEETSDDKTLPLTSSSISGSLYKIDRILKEIKVIRQQQGASL